MNDWEEYRGIFLSMTIIIGVIVFIIILITDGRSIIKEENYVAMETLVQSISKDNDVTQIIDSEKIHSYNVNFNENGDIEIEVEGPGLEIVKATLSSDYQYKSLERENEIFYIIISFILISIVIGLVGSIAIFVPYFIIKFILEYIRG